MTPTVSEKLNHMLYGACPLGIQVIWCHVVSYEYHMSRPCGFLGDENGAAE